MNIKKVSKRLDSRHIDLNYKTIAPIGNLGLIVARDVYWVLKDGITDAVQMLHIFNTMDNLDRLYL